MILIVWRYAKYVPLFIRPYRRGKPADLNRQCLAYNRVYIRFHTLYIVSAQLPPPPPHTHTHSTGRRFRYALMAI